MADTSLQDEQHLQAKPKAAEVTDVQPLPVEGIRKSIYFMH